MCKFRFEAVVSLSQNDFARTIPGSESDMGGKIAARAVFGMEGAHRVTVFADEKVEDGYPRVYHLELSSSWSDEGGAVWGLREDVERVVGDVLTAISGDRAINS